jgi:hypothetical protein
MNTQLSQTAKEIGNEIIDLSKVLDRKMEKWSDSDKRPDDLSNQECVGFINKETAIDGINIMVDLRVPKNDNKAVLRTWVVDDQVGKDNIERFNNIQLAFLINYAQAQLQVQKGSAITREELRLLLHLEDTLLIHLVVSDQSGVDESKGNTVGQRYELNVDELGKQIDNSDTIEASLKSVLTRLKATSANEK